MKVKIEFELTRVDVARAILERARLLSMATGYLDPLSRKVALEWTRWALKGHGRALRASIANVPEEAREPALRAAFRYCPDLPEGDRENFLRGG